MKSSSGALPSNEVEALRALAEKLFTEKYNGNQSAFARDLDITQTNVRRFVVVKQGGVSTQTAKKICKLAGQEFPLDASKLAHLSFDAHTAPPRKRMQEAPIARRIGDAELEKALDFYAGKWKDPTVAAAREAAATHGVSMDRMQWLDALNQLDEMVITWIAHYTEDPSKVLESES